ncbi:MAG: type I-B CRISPR-associated protein Cas5b [bacterium]
METIPIIVFRYSGKYAHFRRPYTNVSSLSYPFPPRPTIAGLLGAILGVPKDLVADTFSEQKLKVAISIENQIKTITHVTNFRQDGIGGIDYVIKRPKKGWKPKEPKNVPAYNKVTQIPMELLVSPSYLVYVHINTDMFENLLSRLKTERFVYTPCLGLSEFLAKIEYITDDKAVALNAGEYKVNSVIPKDDCMLVREMLIPEKHQIQELKAPYLGTVQREFTYRRYFVNMICGSLPVKLKTPCYKFNNTIINFL